jgi:hypothetical protein
MGLTRISHTFSDSSHTLHDDLASQVGEAVLHEHCPRPLERQSQSAERRSVQKKCEKCGLRQPFRLHFFSKLTQGVALGCCNFEPFGLSPTIYLKVARLKDFEQVLRSLIIIRRRYCRCSRRRWGVGRRWVKAWEI